MCWNQVSFCFCFSMSFSCLGSEEPGGKRPRWSTSSYCFSTTLSPTQTQSSTDGPRCHTCFLINVVWRENGFRSRICCKLSLQYTCNTLYQPQPAERFVCSRIRWCDGAGISLPTSPKFPAGIFWLIWNYRKRKHLLDLVTGMAQL